MSRHHRWLKSEIDAWLIEGLIDSEQAQQLQSRYQDARQDHGWGRMIFSAIGAILIGLGVILVFAYNWEEMPKMVKLLVVFCALGGTHGLALVLARKSDARPALIEGLHLLGTMLFGAGIWLVAQIYHIDEHYPNAFVVWSLGAIALAWVMPSLPQAMLGLLLVFVWSCTEVFDSNYANHWAPALVLVTLLPLAWLRRSTVLLFFTLLGLTLVVTFAAGSLDDDAIVTLNFFIALSYILLGLWAPRTAFPEAANSVRNLGFAVYVVLLYLLCFPEISNELFDVDVKNFAVQIYYAIALVSATTSAVLLGRAGLSNIDPLWRWHLVLVGVTTAIVSLISFGDVRAMGWGLSLPLNLIFMAHCGLMVLQGSRAANGRLVSVACLLFTILVMTRYMDLFDSLLARAAAFLILGVGVFVVGNFYSRTKRKMQEAQS